MVIGKYTFVITFEGDKNYIVDPLDENRKNQVVAIVEKFIGKMEIYKVLNYS